MKDHKVAHSLTMKNGVPGKRLSRGQWPGLLVLSLLFCPPILVSAEETPREQIGTVLGQPVYRDQLSAKGGVALSNELHNLFSHPVMQQYRAAHSKELQPTEHEVSNATAHFDGWHNERLKAQDHPLKGRRAEIEQSLTKPGLATEEKQQLEDERQAIDSQLRPPGRRFAGWMVANWRLQRHLYKEYGGGRVLWQQAGLEAFDAMHAWLKQREKAGDFAISDPLLHEQFYAYWTTVDHGPSLSDDPLFIEEEFLNPYWLRPFIGDSLQKNLEADQRR